MPTHERKAGLQKKFSAIFDGVWIPQEARVRRPSCTCATDSRDDVPPKPEALIRQVARIQKPQPDAYEVPGTAQLHKSKGAGVVETFKQTVRRIFG